MSLLSNNPPNCTEVWKLTLRTSSIFAPYVSDYDVYCVVIFFSLWLSVVSFDLWHWSELFKLNCKMEGRKCNKGSVKYLSHPVKPLWWLPDVWTAPTESDCGLVCWQVSVHAILRNIFRERRAWLWYGSGLFPEYYTFKFEPLQSEWHIGSAFVYISWGGSYNLTVVSNCSPSESLDSKWWAGLLWKLFEAALLPTSSLLEP